MQKSYLLAPGPTPVPDAALRAMAEPMWHHRTPRFRDLYKSVSEGLQYVIQTSGNVYSIASSGSGAMEAAVVNLLGASEKALVVQGGKFGERWTDICKAYGIPVLILDVNWGDPVDPAKVAALAKSDPAVKAVFLTLCETSTATHTDVQAVAKALAGTDILVVVDGISAIGGSEFRMDAWGVDAAVVGSQKALMTPPGLAYIALSARADAKMESVDRPRFYLDLRAYKDGLAKQDPPFTPPVTLFVAQGESLRMIREDGIENVWTRTAAFGKATRAAVQAMGLKVFSKAPSDCVTAICIPDGVDGGKVVSHMRDVQGVTPAGGQGKLKGKIVRLTHMGYIDKFDLIVGLTALAGALAAQKAPVDLGAGINTFLKTLGDAK